MSNAEKNMVRPDVVGLSGLYKHSDHLCQRVLIVPRFALYSSEPTIMISSICHLASCIITSRLRWVSIDHPQKYPGYLLPLSLAISINILSRKGIRSFPSRIRRDRSCQEQRLQKKFPSSAASSEAETCVTLASVVNGSTELKLLTRPSRTSSCLYAAVGWYCGTMCPERAIPTNVSPRSVWVVPIMPDAAMVLSEGSSW